MLEIACNVATFRIAPSIPLPGDRNERKLPSLCRSSRRTVATQRCRRDRSPRRHDRPIALATTNQLPTKSTSSPAHSAAGPVRSSPAHRLQNTDLYLLPITLSRLPISVALQWRSRDLHQHPYSSPFNSTPGCLLLLISTHRHQTPFTSITPPTTSLQPAHLLPFFSK